MTPPFLPIEIPEAERTPLVNRLLNVIAQQQQAISKQQEIITKLEEKVTHLEEKVGRLDKQLKAAKKLKGKPKIRPSTLNQGVKLPQKGGKRPGWDKRSKKTDFVVDEERIIEPEDLPEGATFNGYREYDVQDLLLARHNIRFLRFGVCHTRGQDNGREVTRRISGTLWADPDVVYPVSALPVSSAAEFNLRAA
jgi:uncharacterized coiled-coil protein SlyX